MSTTIDDRGDRGPRENYRAFADRLKDTAVQEQRALFDEILGKGAWERAYTPFSEVSKADHPTSDLHDTLWRRIEAKSF